jgi:beta-lactam-binding protein with PASTA domain
MKRSYVLTAVSTAATIDHRGQARLTVVVANTRERPMPSRAAVVTEQPLSAPWLTLAEDPTFVLPPLGSRTLTLVATVPPEAALGVYRAQVAVWAEEAPDADYVTGPTLAVEVPLRPVAAPRRFPWVLILLVLVTLVGLAAPWAWATTATLGWRHRVEVPHLVGVPSPQAADLLAPALAFGIVTQAPTGDRPVGCLLAQDPPPGTIVPAGSTVAVTVHGGILVPRVLGRTVDAARQVATANQLYLAPPTLAAEVADQALGTILRQQPDPDTPVAAGSTVTIVVLDGVVVPVLQGTSLDIARSAATASGLDLTVAPDAPGGPTYREDLEKPQVTGQTPAAGTKIPKGSAITVTVVYPPLAGGTP